jgi:hypothetical protein
VGGPENYRFFTRLHASQPDFRVMAQAHQVARQRAWTVVARFASQSFHFIRKRNLDNEYPQIGAGVQDRPESLIGLGVAADRKCTA